MDATRAARRSTDHNLSPLDRLRKSYAADASWGNTVDRTARTQPGRDAFLAKCEAEVDPEQKMSPEDRRKAALSRRRAHMKRIAVKGVEARQRKRADARKRKPTKS